MRTIFKLCLAIFILTPGLSFAQSRGGGGGGMGSGPQFYFEESFFPVYVNKTDTTTFNTAPGAAAETGLGVDARTTLGIAFWGQMLVGATYNVYALKTKRPEVSGGDQAKEETTNRNEFGPTLGYLNGGFRFLATFFLSGTQTYTTKYSTAANGTESDVQFKYKDMSGFQLTAGYSFAIVPGFEIGPSLVYRSIAYKKQSKSNALTPAESYGDTALYSKASDSSLSAMLSVLARF